MCKVSLSDVERKTRNPLKFAGVPQTGKPISAVSRPKFVILWGHLEDMLLFNKFFRLSIHALVAKIQSDKFVRWCPDGEFLAIFCVLYFSEPRAAEFRLAFLLRTMATLCVSESMVDIQSATAENRRGKKKKKERKKERKKKKPQNENITAYIGRP